MKWVLLAIPLMALTPLHNSHDTQEKIDQEFRQIENELQDKNFRIVGSTPALGDLRNGEIVILSSLTVNYLMWRAGNDLYSVKGSCVTSTR